jgi:hypothetical protein
MKRLAFLVVLGGCGDSIALHSVGDAGTAGDASSDATVLLAQTICGQPEPTVAPSAIEIHAAVSSYYDFIIDSATVDAFRAGDSTPLASTTLPNDSLSSYAFDLSVPTNGVPFRGYLRARIGHDLLDGYWYPAAAFASDFTSYDYTLALVLPWVPYHLSNQVHDPMLGVVLANYTDCAGKGVYGATVTVSPPVVVYYQSSNDPTTTPNAMTYGASFSASPGTYTITVSSPGILWRTTTIEVFANSWNNVEIKPL